MIRMGLQGLEGLAEGLKDLEKELVALGANEGRRVLTRAARKAFVPVLDAAKAGIEAVGAVDSGTYRDSIVIVTQKPKGGESVVNVGLRIKKATFKRTSRHKTTSGQPRNATSAHWRWHFIERGTSTQTARPFLRPALDANAEKVVGNLRAELRKAIDRALKRQKKAGKLGTLKTAAKAYARAGRKGFTRGLR